MINYFEDELEYNLQDSKNYKKYRTWNINNQTIEDDINRYNKLSKEREENSKKLDDVYFERKDVPDEKKEFYDKETSLRHEIVDLYSKITRDIESEIYRYRARNIVNVNDDNVLTFLKEHVKPLSIDEIIKIGRVRTSDTPVEGSSFVLSNGLYTINDVSTHFDFVINVVDRLAYKLLSVDSEVTDDSSKHILEYFINELGWARVNSGTESVDKRCYCVLPNRDMRLTSAQYSAYEQWFDFVQTLNQKSVKIFVEDKFDFVYHSYDFSEYTSEEIISKMKRYYSSGRLYEDVERMPADYKPQKTGIAYKVFYKGKDGKLYPPMVANQGGADTPIGVWLKAQVADMAAPSKTGRPQVQGGGTGTRSGKLSLAFRPGWHLGDIPLAKQFLHKDGTWPKELVWAEVEYAMDINYQDEADEQGYIRYDKEGKEYKSDKYQHSLAGLKKIPENGYYKYRTNPNPDTVPWVITGAMKVNRLLTQDEVKDILKKQGIEAPEIREELENNKKLKLKFI